jgi:hypothetical protein
MDDGARQPRRSCPGFPAQAIRTTSATTRAVMATERRCHPGGRTRRPLRRFPSICRLLFQLLKSQPDIGGALGPAFRILAQTTANDLVQFHRHACDHLAGGRRCCVQDGAKRELHGDGVGGTVRKIGAVDVVCGRCQGGSGRKPIAPLARSGACGPRWQ